MLKKYIKEYLKKDKSRSNKSNLIKLLISDKEKFKEIDSFISFGTFKQKLFHFVNGVNDIQKCLICKSDVKWNEKDFCYRETCSNKCSGKLNLCRNSPKIISHPVLTTKKEYYNYFTSNVIKIKESSIIRYYPELIDLISNIKFVDDFNQRIYCYLKDLHNIPLCKNCGLNSVKFNTFNKGYHDFCSVKCSSNSKSKKYEVIKTNLCKYGVENISMITREKALSTMNEKYGSHISLTNQFKEKFKETSLKNHGVDHPFKSRLIKNKILNSILNEYEVDNVMRLQVIIDKGLKTKQDRGLIFKWSEYQLKSFESYRQKVTHHSNKNYLKNIDILNPENNIRGHLTYHLDHIYPVILGFVNSIDAELLANIKNLQIIPHLENRSKGGVSDMTTEDFYKLIEN